MLLDEKKVTAAAFLVAAAGIALLFLMGETPRSMGIAEALVAQPNTLVILEGAAQNVTGEKFLLCERLCISVRAGGLPSLYLLSEGRQAKVQGRIMEYMGKRYLEAEGIELRRG